MKKLLKQLCFCAALLCFLPNLHAQNNNPCNMRWGNLQTVMTHNWGNVYIRVQTADCNRAGGICGWPIIALEHSFAENATVSVELRGVDCENKPMKAGFSTGGNKIAGNIEFKGKGNWHMFRQVQEVVRVEVSFEKDGDRYELVLDKEKNTRSILKNGQLMDGNGRTAREEENLQKEKQQKEQEAAAQKKREEDDKIKEEEAKKEEKAAARKAEEDRLATERYNESVRLQKRADSLREIEEDRTNRLQVMHTENIANKAFVSDVTGGVAAVAMGETNNIKNEKEFRVKADIAVGYDQVPAFSNTTGRDPRYKWSRYDAQGYMSGNAALFVGFRPAKEFEIYIKPQLTYGVQLSEGTTGSYMEYAGAAGFTIGNRVKLGAEVQYGQRTGDYSGDGDAVTASVGVYTNDQLITTATVDHSYLRYEGYLLFETSSETDSYIRLGAGMDKPSFSNQQVMFYKGRFVFGKFLVEALYSPAYPLDGKADYSLDTKSDKALLSVKLGVVFNL